jgi:hypothetical protein
MIGIAKLFPLGVEDQLIVDTRVEEISWHGVDPCLLDRPVGAYFLFNSHYRPK